MLPRPLKDKDLISALRLSEVRKNCIGQAEGRHPKSHFFENRPERNPENLRF